METLQLNFRIEQKGPVSKTCLERDLKDFRQAMEFVKQLPYGRNANKNDLLSVFTEQRGTCSTKHALLKEPASENNFPGLALIISIYKMNASNTPAVKNILETHGLEYIPEAHNYLYYKEKKVDCTGPGWNAERLTNDILEEKEILPAQITDFKVAYHKAFLERWLKEQKNISYSLEVLWEIREQCIRDLSA